jgi:GxxExxY protein
MNTDEHGLNQVTERVLGCAYKVSNTLGCGFLEKVYENALALEMRKEGLKVVEQYPLRVFYEGTAVGDYVADLLVEDVLLLELKAVRALDEVQFAQCLNYLRASGLKLCLLINFGNPRLEVRRIVS